MLILLSCLVSGHAGHGQQAIVVPFRLAADGVPIIMVDVEVSDQKGFKFVLDTGNGAFPVLVSDALSKKLGLVTKQVDIGGTKIGVGEGERPKLSSTVLERIRIGSLVRERIEAGVSDAIDSLARRTSAQIDGNIGYGFLKEFAVTIDYKTSTLTLDPRAHRREGVPFKLGDKPLIVTDVSVNGTMARFIVDTGAGMTVVSDRLAKRLSLSLGAETPLIGASGNDTAHFAKVDMVRVGSTERKEMSVVVHDMFDFLSPFVGERVEGILGYDFLKNYRVTIDYPRKTLSFERS